MSTHSGAESGGRRGASSPDWELIHYAIEAFEEHLARSERRKPLAKGGSRMDCKDKAKWELEEKGKPSKERKKAAAVSTDGGGASEEVPSALISRDEEVVETVYHAEVVTGSGEGVGMEMVAVCQERRRGWADVMGLFNSHFWSLLIPSM